MCPKPTVIPGLLFLLSLDLFIYNFSKLRRLTGRDLMISGPGSLECIVPVMTLNDLAVKGSHNSYSMTFHPGCAGWQGINTDPVSLSPDITSLRIVPKVPPDAAQCVSSRCPLSSSPGFTNIGKILWPRPNPLICVFKLLSFLQCWGLVVMWLKITFV